MQQRAAGQTRTQAATFFHMLACSPTELNWQPTTYCNLIIMMRTQDISTAGQEIH